MAKSKKLQDIEKSNARELTREDAMKLHLSQLKLIVSKASVDKVKFMEQIFQRDIKIHNFEASNVKMRHKMAEDLHTKYVDSLMAETGTSAFDLNFDDATYEFIEKDSKSKESFLANTDGEKIKK